MATVRMSRNGPGVMTGRDLFATSIAGLLDRIRDERKLLIFSDAPKVERGTHIVKIYCPDGNIVAYGIKEGAYLDPKSNTFITVKDGRVIATKGQHPEASNVRR